MVVAGWPGRGMGVTGAVIVPLAGPEAIATRAFVAATVMLQINRATPRRPGTGAAGQGVGRTRTHAAFPLPAYKSIFPFFLSSYHSSIQFSWPLSFLIIVVYYVHGSVTYLYFCFTSMTFFQVSLSWML